MVIGRGTFEKVLEFDAWPYDKPVYLLSRTLERPPAGFEDKVSIVRLKPADLLAHLYEAGFRSAYIDGGKVVQSFLAEDLIDELIVAKVPVLIGEGSRFVITPRTFAGLAYLTIFGSVIAYSSFIFALAHMRATSLSLYAYVNPAVAVVLGWLILDEKLTWVSIVAMVVILGGVAIVQTARGEKTPAAPVEVEEKRNAA